MAPRRTAQTAVIALLLLGCTLVLIPFFPAMLFAGSVCITTWPLYRNVVANLRGRSGLAALAMTLMLTLVLLVPLLALATSLTDAVTALADYARTLIEQADSGPPAFVSQLPFIGDELAGYWRRVAGNEQELKRLALEALEPARRWALALGTVLGQGMLQVSLVLFILFFFYRDGARLYALVETGAKRLGGDLGEHLVEIAANTVKAVMIGLVGTAAAQALVALVGFVIAGVPGAFLLSAGVFFLSVVPIGPPLLWGGAAFWLYQQGETGWAIFMVAWGALVISSVDNFVKPVLISRTASLPFLLIALGAFGGVLAFGFIGLFLGPTVLALGQSLFLTWTAIQERPADQSPADAARETRERIESPPRNPAAP